MNKLQFILLSILEQKSMDSPLRSMSAYDICEEFDEDFAYHTNYIRTVLQNFKKIGVVECGLKDGKSITFYITNKGKELLKKYRK